MRKRTVLSLALVIGMLSAGAPASASTVTCMDRQAFQQYNQETAALSSELKAKEVELGMESAYVVREGSPPVDPDMRRVFALESQIRDLKAQINASAQKYGLSCVELP